MLLGLILGSFFLGQVWAGEQDKFVHDLVERVLSSDFDGGRHRLALKKLKVARLACRGDACSKSVLAEVEIATGIVEASGLERHKDAVASFRRALAANPKAVPPKKRNDDKVKKAFEEASESIVAEPAIETEPSRRIAVYVEADDPASAEKTIRDALGSDYEIVDSGEYATQLQDGGYDGPMRKWLRSERLKTWLVQAAHTANQNTKATGAILGVVDGKQLDFLVVDASGEVTGEQTANFAADDIAEALEPTLGKLFPEGGAEKEPAPPHVDAAVTADESPTTVPADVTKPPPKKDDGYSIDIGDDFVFTPSGQYLARFQHHENHDFATGNAANTFSHRARLGLAGMYKKSVGAFVQVQDVRMWGSETNTFGDFSADGLDMHQAYLRMLPIEQLEFRIGRQEINFQNHRLIGNVGWTTQARSFDALRAILTHEGWVKAEAFFSRVQEDSTSPVDPDPSGVHPADRNTVAGYVGLTRLKELSPTLVFISNQNEAGEGPLTFGGLVGGKTDVGFSYSVEGYYQFGDDVIIPPAPAGPLAASHSAWLFAVMARMDIDVQTKPFLGGQIDVLSGDDTPEDAAIGVFDTLYATNHKFYGEMDFFLNIPVHTQGRGLLDANGFLGFKPLEDGLAQVTFHHFRAIADRPDGLTIFGNELDFKLGYKPIKHLSLDLVYAVFMPGDIFEAGVAAPADPRAEHFAYSTADVSF